MTQEEGSAAVEVNVKVELSGSAAAEEQKPAAVAVSGNGAVDPGMTDKLVRQIEFYFGDANLPHDKFMKTTLANNEGWFPIDVLLKFNKLNQIMGSVPVEQRPKTIVEALPGSVLIEVNEAKDKIRRNPEVPLPEGSSDRRTVYLKGFHKTETKLEQLIEHFKKYEGMEAVIMRHYNEKVLLADIKKEEDKKDESATTDKDSNPLAKYEAVTDKIAFVKKFKGSILVAFKTEEQAKAALADITTYCGNELLKMMQFEYTIKKKEEYENRQKSRKRKFEEDEDAVDNSAATDDSSEPKGIFVKLTEIPKGYSREQVKEHWYKALDEEKFDIAFVDFQKGDTEGILRLSRENAGVEALESLKEKDSKFPVGDDAFVKVSGFDEEEEKKYRIKVKADRSKYKKLRGGGFGGGRGRGGGGGRRGGRGNKRGRHH